MRHVPICGYNYDPPAPEPKDEFIIGERYAPAVLPEQRPKVKNVHVVLLHISNSFLNFPPLFRLRL
jgi:hypothetical protein